MDQDASNSETGLQGEEGFREQDRFLPISNVYRIMRKAVPENAKISKEAKELVQECVSEFISFITSEYGLISARSCFLLAYKPFYSSHTQSK